MKLLRIGSSPQCDIVLNSQYVSSLHAEMTILDDGQIILEDKNSTNGTTVGKKKLEPGKEVSVQRGDMINFADEPLVWARVPAAEKLTAYKAVYNIGSNFRNDIILNSQSVSRYHAALRIGKDGKAYIRDNGSKNGTTVNGIKLSANKDVRIKKGDVVICGTEDVTEQLATLLPSSNLGLILGILGGVVGVAAIALIAFFLWPRNTTPTAEPINPEDYRPAVVYVRTIFHPVVTFDDNPMPDEWNGEVPFEAQMLSQATAFFIDSVGRMATNRHVAEPWEELTQDQKDQIRQTIEDNLPKGSKDEDINAFLNTSFFAPSVLKYSREKCNNDPRLFVKYVLRLTSDIRKSSYKITGKIDHITVGYPGNYYTHEDEFQRCNVLKVSDTKEVDLAILQLNNKTTPKDIVKIFNPLDVPTDMLVPLKDQLYTIGYPAGLRWSQDDNSKSLEPSIRETKCSKEPGKYDFEFQANSVGGSSGSPVFNTEGQLVGVLYGGYSIAGGATKAVHAKFLKKLYEEELNP